MVSLATRLQKESADLAALEKDVLDMEHKRDSMMTNKGFVGMALTMTAKIDAAKLQEHELKVQSTLKMISIRKSALEKVAESIKKSTEGFEIEVIDI